MTAQGFDLEQDYELPDRDYRTMNRLAGRSVCRNHSQSQGHVVM